MWMLMWRKRRVEEAGCTMVWQWWWWVEIVGWRGNSGGQGEEGGGEWRRVYKKEWRVEGRLDEGRMVKWQGDEWRNVLRGECREERWKVHGGEWTAGEWEERTESMGE